MDVIASREKPRLPQQWAAEMALVANSPPSSDAPPPETVGGRAFDSQLDGFLDRFQREIVAARALKDQLDRAPHKDAAHATRKDEFKRKMEHIRALFATEGEEFVASLEKRNPKLTMAACGQNTLELAKGIERLETAVKEEETKRTEHYPKVVGLVSKDRKPDARTDVLGAEYSPASRVTPPGIPPIDTSTTPFGSPNVGHALQNLNSDETLQLMQSDIQALKLELMRLQRAKTTASSFSPSGPLSLPPVPPGAMPEGASTFSMSTVSPGDKETAALPASILNNNNLNIVRVTGRANNFAPTYVSHLEQMKSRLEALEKKPLGRRAKSAARLGRTQTMGSMYETPPMIADENQNPNISAMVTPPRGVRRMKHRSISTQSPLNQHQYSSPREEVHPQQPLTPGSSPSPTRPSFKKTEGNATTPARLFFDGPEEMLSRPQSHAAARDIQRYSLKVARRFGPTEIPTMHNVEPRAKSAVTVSPTRRRALHGEGMAIGHTLSDVGTVSQAPPSTIDTNGSGGRVVEEIEGDMWVRKGVVWKRWRRRYASIVSHQFFGRVMCLFSYDSSGGVISTRSQIVVLHGSLCRAMREKVEIGGHQRFMFVLRTTAKEYYFAAENDEIRRNWIRELREAARKDNVRMILPGGKGRSMAFKSRLS